MNAPVFHFYGETPSREKGVQKSPQAFLNPKSKIFSFCKICYCAAGNSFSRSSFKMAVARCMVAAARRSSASPSSARIRR